MADHPNVELLRRGYEAFGSGDMDTLSTLFADDIVWHNAGRNQLSGEFKSRDQVFAFFGRLMELSGGTARVEAHDILANDEHGVAIVNSSASRNGKTLKARAVHVFHLRNGKVTEFWDAPLDQYADDEFWS